MKSILIAIPFLVGINYNTPEDSTLVTSNSRLLKNRTSEITQTKIDIYELEKNNPEFKTQVMNNVFFEIKAIVLEDNEKLYKALTSGTIHEQNYRDIFAELERDYNSALLLLENVDMNIYSKKQSLNSYQDKNDYMTKVINFVNSHSPKSKWDTTIYRRRDNYQNYRFIFGDLSINDFRYKIIKI